MDHAMKSGLGTASIEIGAGLLVGAIVAVNAFGDVTDPASGAILAGARSAQEPSYFANTLTVLQDMATRQLSFGPRQNTVIGVVATNARFNKEQINKVAQMAQDGLARSIRPAHTMVDGDTIFALSTGELEADVNVVGAFAAEVFARAVVRAVQAAIPMGGLPSVGSRH
jgi:L-aminopeptidase/D-esterase-like protein